MMQFLLLVFCYICIVGAEHDMIIDVTVKNINDVLLKQPLLLEFFAPWCVHCKHFEQPFTTLANNLAKDNVTVGRVDVSLNPALSSLFEVKSIPVFYLCRTNKMWKYDNYRELNSEGLTNFVLQDYSNAPPISLWNSPIGLVGSIKRYLIQLGDQALDFIPNLSKKYGISNVFGIFLIMMSVCISILLATVVGVYFSVYMRK